MSTLYLAGPMTGYPRWNFDAFEAGTKALRDVGFQVISPAELDLLEGFDPDAPTENYSQEDFVRHIRRDANLILNEADGLALLDGWGASRGALFEVSIATMLRLPIRGVRTWIEESVR